MILRTVYIVKKTQLVLQLVLELTVDLFQTVYGIIGQVQLWMNTYLHYCINTNKQQILKFSSIHRSRKYAIKEHYSEENVFVKAGPHATKLRCFRQRRKVILASCVNGLIDFYWFTQRTLIKHKLFTVFSWQPLFLQHTDLKRIFSRKNS